MYRYKNIYKKYDAEKYQPDKSEVVYEVTYGYKD